MAESERVVTEPAPETPFWVSWYARAEYGEFELHSPWWISGWRLSDDARTICAAVMASDEEAAQEAVYASYDVRPSGIEFRFVEPQDSYWIQFSDRFPRADWMRWPEMQPAE